MRILLMLLVAASVAWGYNVAHLTDSNFTCWDGVTRKIDVSYPDTNAQFPLIMLGHGYIGSKGDIATSVKERFCGYGFVVACITTRKNSGAQEILDFYDAVKYVESKYPTRVNGRRIYSGYSGGGGNGYSILTRCPDLFNMIVCSFGMNDYERWYNNTIEANQAAIVNYIGDNPTNKPKQFAARNSINLIRNNPRTRLFMLHDNGDGSVPGTESDAWRDTSISLGYTNYTYTRTNWQSAVEAIHGMPETSTVGAPNIEFEHNIAPHWADTARLASLYNVEIPANGTFKAGVFVRTKKFAVICSDSDIVNVNYDTAAHRVKIINNISGNTISNGLFIASGLLPRKTYHVIRSYSSPDTFEIVTDSLGEFRRVFSVNSNDSVQYAYTRSTLQPYGGKGYFIPAKINGLELKTTDSNLTLLLSESFFKDSSKIFNYDSNKIIITDKDGNKLKKIIRIFDRQNKKLELAFLVKGYTAGADYPFFVNYGGDTAQANDSSAFTESGHVMVAPLNEASGTLYDDCKAYNGTTVNAWTYGTTGKIGTALKETNVNQYTNHGDITFMNNTQNFTVRLWSKVVNAAVNTGGWYKGWNSGANSGSLAGVYLGGSSKLYANMDTAATQNRATCTATPAISNNTWYNYAVIYDGTLAAASRYKIILNDSVQTMSVPNGTIPASTPSSSGKYVYLQSAVTNQEFDEFRILNKSLSNEQAKLYYKNENTFSTNGLFMLGLEDSVHVRKFTRSNKPSISLDLGL